MGTTPNLLQDKISEHFYLHEFYCKDGMDSMIITEEFLFFVQFPLEDFRVWYNRSIVPNDGSAFRTIPYNISVGGAAKSGHLRAIAVDIHFPEYEHDGVTKVTEARKQEILINVRTKWYNILKSYGMTGGVGWYDWGFHIDAKDDGSMRFWDYRGVNPKYSAPVDYIKDYVITEAEQRKVGEQLWQSKI